VQATVFDEIVELFHAAAALDAPIPANDVILAGGVIAFLTDSSRP
jgi:hypothetical protein